MGIYQTSNTNHAVNDGPGHVVRAQLVDQEVVDEHAVRHDNGRAPLDEALDLDHHDAACYSDVVRERERKGYHGGDQPCIECTQPNTAVKLHTEHRTQHAPSQCLGQTATLHPTSKHASPFLRTPLAVVEIGGQPLQLNDQLRG